MTQCEKILEFMERHGRITQMEALDYCGCARLASRIWDLKDAGYNIEKEMVKVRCRDGSFAYVAAYSFYKTIEQKHEELKKNVEVCRRAAIYWCHMAEEDSNYGYAYDDAEEELEKARKALEDFEKKHGLGGEK